MGNPYGTQLGSRDAMQVLESTASRLSQLTRGIGEKQIDKPRAPGKWSAREILIHLADTELAFGFRYRQALGEDDHLVQPFDQDKWAKTYSIYDAAQALSTFISLRNWNLALVRSLTAEQLSKPVTHPERGKMVFKTMLETAAGHDLNHLKQLEEIASR